MKNLSILVVLFTALQGCAGINQPVAKLSLVEAKQLSEDVDLISQSAWEALRHSGEGATISLREQTARLGKLFFSASGKQCRQFYFEQELVRIACKVPNSEQWHFIKPVISEYIELDKQE